MTDNASRTQCWNWAVAGVGIFRLVVVPAIIFAEIRFGVFSTAGLGSYGFALLVISTGLALGSLSALTMLGPP